MDGSRAAPRQANTCLPDAIAASLEPYATSSSAVQEWRDAVVEHADGRRCGLGAGILHAENDATEVGTSIIAELGTNCGFEQMCDLLNQREDLININGNIDVSYINDDTRNQ